MNPLNTLLGKLSTEDSLLSQTLFSVRLSSRADLLQFHLDICSLIT